MQFKKLKNRLSNLSNLALPGETAQDLMAPQDRISRPSENEINNKSPRWAGVVALFYPSSEGEAMLVLILRNTYKGVHSNQVGFPGGRSELYDASIEQTALRETEEEIGVGRHTIKLVKKMTKIYIPPSNFWVQPFIGYVDYTPTFIPEVAEVAAVLEIRVDDFLALENVITTKITTSYAVAVEVPAFLLNDHRVWGATAIMLSEIKTLLINSNP